MSCRALAYVWVSEFHCPSATMDCFDLFCNRLERSSICSRMGWQRTSMPFLHFPRLLPFNLLPGLTVTTSITILNWFMNIYDMYVRTDLRSGEWSIMEICQKKKSTGLFCGPSWTSSMFTTSIRAFVARNSIATMMRQLDSGLGLSRCSCAMFGFVCLTLLSLSCPWARSLAVPRQKLLNM